MDPNEIVLEKKVNLPFIPSEASFKGTSSTLELCDPFVQMRDYTVSWVRYIENSDGTFCPPILHLTEKEDPNSEGALYKIFAESNEEIGREAFQEYRTFMEKRGWEFIPA
jgi:hypothetical protein